MLAFPSYRVLSYRLLHGEGYIFRRRGNIEVKGKGQMTTHFLVGKIDNQVMEPQDEFCSLPLEGGVHNGVSTADIGVNDFTSSSTEKTFTQANDPKSSQICSIL